MSGADASSTPKKVFTKTYGCQMNVYDTDRMVEALAADGYVATETVDDADLIVLNTCHIRERAAEKVYSELGRMRELKDRRSAAGRDTIITVAGCVAQAEGLEIVTRQPAVDLVIGPQSTHRLNDLVREVSAKPQFDMFGKGRARIETEFAEAEKFTRQPARLPGRAGGQSRPLAGIARVGRSPPRVRH